MACVEAGDRLCPVLPASLSWEQIIKADDLGATRSEHGADLLRDSQASLGWAEGLVGRFLLPALAGCWLSFLQGLLFYPDSQISKLAALLASFLPAFSL